MLIEIVPAQKAVWIHSCDRCKETFKDKGNNRRHGKYRKVSFCSNACRMAYTRALEKQEELQNWAATQPCSKVKV